MTDIFARKPAPLPTSKVPTVWCEPWITVFERSVSEAQKRLNSMRDMEAPYVCVKAALDAAKLPRDVKVTTAVGDITVRIALTHNDYVSHFEDFGRDLGRRLQDAGLHHDGEPSRSSGGFYPLLMASWFLWRGDNNKNGTVFLVLELPEGGTRDMKVLAETRTYESTEWKVVPREPERSRIAEDAERANGQEADIQF
jgi:hypothetical protein